MRFLIALLAVCAAGTLWAAEPEIRVDARPELVAVSTDGDQAWDVIPLGPGRFLLSLATVSEGRPAIHTYYLSISDADGPAPGPGPDPGPQPNPPDDLTGLARDVRDQARKIEDAETAAALASAFNATASQIAAGALDDPHEIVAEQTRRNREAVGDAREAWLTFFTWLEDELQQRADDGEMVTPEEHRQIWLQIAEGLEHV